MGKEKKKVGMLVDHHVEINHYPSLSFVTFWQEICKPTCPSIHLQNIKVGG